MRPAQETRAIRAKMYAEREAALVATGDLEAPMLSTGDADQGAAAPKKRHAKGAAKDAE